MCFVVVVWLLLDSFSPHLGESSSDFAPLIQLTWYITSLGFSRVKTALHFLNQYLLEFESNSMEDPQLVPEIKRMTRRGDPRKTQSLPIKENNFLEPFFFFFPIKE